MREQFGNITLINGDCMDVLRGLSDNAFDLAIVDPPYGIGGDSIHAGRRNKSALKGSGKLKERALNSMDTSWDIAPTQEYFDHLFRVSRNQIICGGNYFNLPPTRGIACWDKVQPWDNFSQIEYLWTSFNYPAKLFKLDNRTGGKIHPTQKPVALYNWLLHNYAKEGDTILDTHMGSGSSCIACHDMGFMMTGIELNKKYYEGARQRLIDHQMQQKLF